MKGLFLVKMFHKELSNYPLVGQLILKVGQVMVWEFLEAQRRNITSGNEERDLRESYEGSIFSEKCC